MMMMMMISIPYYSSHSKTTYVLKPNADPVVVTVLSSAVHELRRCQCSALFVVVAEQEVLLSRNHEIVQHKCIVLSVVSLIIMVMPFCVCAFIDPCRG